MAWLRGVGAVPLQIGQPVTAAVRPEKVVPLDDPGGVTETGALNACKGTVEEVIYVGDATRYRVALGADGAVTVKVPVQSGCVTAGLLWLGVVMSLRRFSAGF